MAKFAATDVRVTINGTDWSTYIAGVTLTYSYAELDVTAFSNPGKVSAQGLIEGELKLDFHQDFAGGTASLDATLWTLTTATTLATVVITPQGSSVGTNNPKYTVTCRPLSYEPLSVGAVGDLATVSVTWPLAANGTVSPVVRATA